jgi:hypothetical protein
VTWSLFVAALANFGAAALVALEARKSPGAVRATDVGPARDVRAATPPPVSPAGSPALAPVAEAAAVPGAPASSAGAGAAPAGAGANVLLLIGFFLSSFASIALENVWTRHLSFFFGAQTYTFAFVLFGYLLGLFLGGAAYAWLSGRMGPATLLGRGLLIAAVGVAVPIPFLAYIAIPQIKLMLGMGISNGTFLLTSGHRHDRLVLVPAFGFGLVFPAVVDLLARSGRRTARRSRSPTSSTPRERRSARSARGSGSCRGSAASGRSS